MKSNINCLGDSLNKIRKNSNINIYREIDFLYDIDNSKSNYYILDKRSEEITFVCKKSVDLLHLIDKNYSFRNFNYSISYEGNIIFNVNEYDRVNPYIFDYELKNKEFLFFNYNKTLFNYDKRIYVGLHSGICNDLESGLQGDSIWIRANKYNTYIGVRYNNNCKTIKCDNRMLLNKMLLLGNSIKEEIYLINISYIENLFKNFYPDFCPINFRKYFKYPFIFGESSTKNSKFQISKEDLFIGEINGEVYLKPIKINSFDKNFLLKTIYKGNIQIEILSDNKWNNIENYMHLDIKNNSISLKIKLCSATKLLNMFILNV